MKYRNDDYSRIARKRKTEPKSNTISTISILITFVLIINLLGVGFLIYITMEDRSTRSQQQSKIALIEQQIENLKQSEEGPNSSQLPASSQPESSKAAERTSASSSVSQTAETTEESSTSSSAQGTKVYVVEEGDTLSTIATNKGLTIEKLKALNELTDDIIQVGQELNLD